MGDSLNGPPSMMDGVLHRKIWNLGPTTFHIIIEGARACKNQTIPQIFLINIVWTCVTANNLNKI